MFLSQKVKVKFWTRWPRATSALTYKSMSLCWDTQSKACLYSVSVSCDTYVDLLPFPGAYGIQRLCKQARQLRHRISPRLVTINAERILPAVWGGPIPCKVWLSVGTTSLFLWSIFSRQFSDSLPEVTGEKKKNTTIQAISVGLERCDRDGSPHLALLKETQKQVHTVVKINSI